MFHSRMPRRVEVDWSRRRGERIPITQGATYAFGEPGYAERGGEPVEGMICWDPADGWVLDVPPKRLEEALSRPEADASTGPDADAGPPPQFGSGARPKPGSDRS